jgi:hypothetical protein
MSVSETSYNNSFLKNPSTNSISFDCNLFQHKSSKNLILSDKLESRYIKNTVYYLLIKENFIFLSKQDQDRVLKLKRKFDFCIYRGVVCAALSYSFIFKLLIRKDSALKALKSFKKPFKTFVDIFCLLSIPIMLSSYNIRDVKLEKAEVDRLKNQYSLILKNSILLGQNPYLGKNNDILSIIMNKIHHDSERSFFFVFLLLLRIFL